VQVGSELWTAEAADPSESPIRANEQVVVVALTGLTLRVRRLTPSQDSPTLSSGG